MKLNILTYNIHKGFNWNNSKLTIQSLRGCLRELNPDIIFLQEVVGENKKLEVKLDHWISNQIDFLAEEIWPNISYSRHALFDHKNHGNVILSKFDIIDSEIVNISLNPLEQRALLFSKLQVENRELHCYCTHLNLLHRDRVQQYRHIQDFIKKNSHKTSPLLLAGDFNDWNQKASSKLFHLDDLQEAYKSLHGEYAKTYPSFFPFFKLDRIYTRSLNIHQARVLEEKRWKDISDHLPIHLEIEL